MRFIIELDADGLAQVDIVATSEEREEAHKLWDRLRPDLERLDALVKNDVTMAAVEVGSDGNRQ